MTKPAVALLILILSGMFAMSQQPERPGGLRQIIPGHYVFTSMTYNRKRDCRIRPTAIASRSISAARRFRFSIWAGHTLGETASCTSLRTTSFI